MNLGPLIQGLGNARLGYSGGRDKQVSANREREDEVKQLMFKLALEKSARDQTQGNADRSASELNRHHVAMEGRQPAPDPVGKRIQELVAGGTPLAAANQQARLEAGETPQAPPRDFTKEHETNRRFDIRNPLPRQSSPEDGPVSTGDVRRSNAADAFAQRMVEAYDGDYSRAMKETEKNPTQKAQASLLKVTAQHYFAAASRMKKKETGTVDAEKYKTDPEYRAFVDSRKE